MRLLFTLIVALACLLPTHEAATATRLKSLRRVQRIYQESNYCHQEVIGSSASLEQLNSEIDAYATAFATHFGLTGDYHQYINFATVPDRTSFDSCAGPYSTVVDVFFKFPASSSDFAQYDAYIQANPLSGLASAQCASVSVVANLPGCSAPSTPTGANPTQPPEVTEAPTTAAPATEAPTSTPTGANPTQAPDTDTNWCHQQVLGSSASLEQLNSELDVYATAFATHFGLTGDYHQYVGWARVPDRTSFDSCAGPYSTVVDVFFKFPASTSSFAQYEAYLQANPLSGLASVQCASVSVVANLPGCSAMGNPTSTPTGANPTQPPEVTEAPTTAAPATEAPTEAPTSTPTGANPTQGPDTDTNWCHQQVLGSSASLEQVNSNLDAYATAFASHFGLTGDYHQYVGWARVPDRTSFDACAGPYSTVVDVFFKFPAATSSFAQYEAYLQSNPLSGLASVQCASVSVVANLPGCSAMGNPSTPTGANPTQPPEVTEAPTTAAPATQAPATEAPTEAPSTPTGANPTQAPAPSGTCQAIDFTYDLTGGVISFTPASGASALNFVDVHVHYAGGQLNYRLSVSPSASPSAPAYEVTLPQGLTGITNYWFTYQTSDNVACDTDSYPVTGGAATTQPTPEAPTEAPTTAPAVTQAPPSSSPANVVCYQEIVGSSSSSYAVVSAALTAWEQKMYQSLGLTGPIDQSVGHAQVPDRNSFENGCNGPYQTVADLFVYIQATDATYQQISQQLEAFIAANPIVGSHSSISCGARSVTTFLPRCGAVNGGGNPTTAPNPTQPPEVTEAPTTAAPATEAPTEAPTSTPTGANPTQPAEVTEAPTEAATEAPTQAPATAAPTTPTGTNPTQPPADECPSYEDGTYVCKNGVCTKVSVTVIGTTTCYTTEASCPAPAA